MVMAMQAIAKRSHSENWFSTVPGEWDDSSWGRYECIGQGQASWLHYSINYRVPTTHQLGLIRGLTYLIFR